MQIGILQTGHTPEAMLPDHHDYGQLFVDLLDGADFTFRIWSVVDGDFPDGPDAADGWLITGSRHGAYEGLPFIPPLEELIRAIYAADKPLVGICFGHQIIAQALGGRVEKFAGGWNVGAKEYDWDGKPVTLNAWHQDQVTRLPADAEVLASNSTCAYAILRYGNRAFTVQAHPEFRASFVEGLARTRGPGVVPDPLLQDAIARLGTPTDNTLLATQIRHFFTERELL
jgi:GMP synthase-like glutamine amidotransferase